MERFCTILGRRAEVAVPFKDTRKHEMGANIEEGLLNLLARRPCTIDDVSSGMGMHKNEAVKYTDLLLKNHRINMVKKDGVVYYQLRDL